MPWQQMLVGVFVAVTTALLIAVLRRALKTLRRLIARSKLPSGIRVLVDDDPETLRRLQDKQVGIGTPLQFHFRGETIDSLPTPHAIDTWDTWPRLALDNGGTPVGWSVMVVTVQVLEEHVVVLEPPFVRHRHAELPDGVQVSPQGLGGGPLQTHLFRWRLVGPDARACDTSDTRSYAMKRGDTERLVLIIEVESGWYEFEAFLPLIVNGKRIVYPLNSSPVAIAGCRYDLMYVWDEDESRWTPPFGEV